jgi:hypothetical protein
METARVDIRRLQLLNDRVNQCIDALNQVRLSVHGLSHTSAGFPGVPFGINPQGQTAAYGGYPFAGQVPFGQLAQQLPFGQIPQQVPFSQIPTQAAGLAHTGPFGPAAGMYGLGAGSFLGAGSIPGLPVSPFIGLSHTGAEAFEGYSRPVWSDPLLAARIAQTFPYAYQNVSPLVAI